MIKTTPPTLPPENVKSFKFFICKLKLNGLGTPFKEAASHTYTVLNFFCCSKGRNDVCVQNCI